MKKQLTEIIRNIRIKVFATVITQGVQSVRSLAEQLGIGKSSAHRQLCALKTRNRYPESSFWETSEGDAWLRLLFFAVLYKFGLEGGVGADKLSEFFMLIRIDTHVGVSTSALRNQLRTMEGLLLRFRKEFEQQNSGKTREVVAATDETFFGNMLILVMMDLPSGYLLLEETAEDRSFETWLAKAQPRLDEMGLKVSHVISDRAKALIKLAVEGFKCLPGADVFHAQNDLAKWLGPAFSRLGASAQKQVLEARVTAEKAVEKQEQNTQKQRVEQAETEWEEVKAVTAEYRESKLHISEIIHPFSTQDNSPQDSRQAKQRLRKCARNIGALALSQGIADDKNILQKFRKQFKDLTSAIDVWWLLVLTEVTFFRLEPARQNWLMFDLLPAVYWHKQMSRTKNPTMRGKYKELWERAQSDWAVHSLTRSMAEEESRHWQACGRTRWPENFTVAPLPLRAVTVAYRKYITTSAVLGQPVLVA